MMKICSSFQQISQFSIFAALIISVVLIILNDEKSRYFNEFKKFLKQFKFDTFGFLTIYTNLKFRHLNFRKFEKKLNF